MRTSPITGPLQIPTSSRISVNIIGIKKVYIQNKLYCISYSNLMGIWLFVYDI